MRTSYAEVIIAASVIDYDLVGIIVIKMISEISRRAEVLLKGFRNVYYLIGMIVKSREIIDDTCLKVIQVRCQIPSAVIM